MDPPDISLNLRHRGCDHVCYMDVWSISSCSWYSGLGISWGGIPWANLPPTSASCLSPPGAVWHPLHSWCPCTERSRLQRVGPQSPPTLRLEGHWWKVKIATVQGHSPGARRTGLELYWKLRPPVILVVSAPQGSPLSTREYCYGRHSNWSYIEGAYVVLYRTPSKSPGVLGLSGPGYRCSLQGPAPSRWADSRRIVVCGSHVERHGVFCAHPGVAWCCCILYVPASYMWLRWGSLGGNFLPCSSLLS